MQKKTDSALADLPDLLINPMYSPSSDFPFYQFDQIEKAARFFNSLPTPLYSLKNLARNLGLGEILVKDESGFLTLNAFKGRGVIWATALVCARRLGISANDFTLRDIVDRLPQNSLTFVTATDGNHGTALAYAAKFLRQNAVVFVPKGTNPQRIDIIESYGAKCVVTDLNYDDTVRLAASYAQKGGHLLIQDTAWLGYEEIPALIMQGYCTLAHEVIKQAGFPDHIFLQTGVGSFAAAMAGAFSSLAMLHNRKRPGYIALEPAAADCLYRSIEANDGRAHKVSGSLGTLMDGLACGELSSLAWPILRANIYAAASLPDALAIRGMRILAKPADDDPLIVSGPSGAPGMGLLDCIMRDIPSWRSRLGLNSDSRVLLISTEGASCKQC